MCGILGVLAPTDRDRREIGHALDLIAHRGPDGSSVLASGEVLLGHRRLAIVDLSDHGSQPMTDPETGVAIVFNGEIYNYKEIRAELEGWNVQFRSDSDTEVLLQAYLRWGGEMFSRLNGMWAFAVWDPRSRTLFASRDRFGVKPFYYAVVGDRFLFASEPKALIRLEPGLARANPSALADVFASSLSHAGSGGFYAEIKALAPATNAVVRAGDGQVRLHRYWSYPDQAEEPEDPAAAAERFAALFEDSVRLRLRCDVPVGLTLSGGLDSSAVLAAAARNAGAAPVCFTSVYGSSLRGEEAWAKRAADVVGARLVTVEAEIGAWRGTLEQIVEHMESPSYSPAIVPLWSIMRAAREAGVPVLLEGQGADELLGGYAQHAPAGLLSGLRADGLGLKSLAAAASDAAALARSFGAGQLALWTLRQLAPSAHRAWSAVRGGASLLQRDVLAVRTPPASAGRDLYQMLREDHSRAILPALLHYGDAVSMAHGVESRLPFMDYRLVDWVFRARPRLMDRGRAKIPVRRYLHDRGFGVIAERQDKLGYPTPILAWLQAEGAASVQDAIADRNSETWDFLRPDRAREVLAAALAGDQRALFQTFKVLTTYIWIEQVKTRRTGVCAAPPLAKAS